MSRKIVHLITGLNTGGAENMLHKIVSNSDKEHFTHIVISLMGKGSFGEKLENLGFKIYTLNMKKRLSSIKAFIKLIKILKQEKPDVLQTWLYHADFLGLIAGKICKIKKIIWNLRCSNMDMKQYGFSSRLLIKILTFLSKKPDAIIFNSYTGKDYHQKIGYQNSNWIYIPNGFNTLLYKPNQEAKKALKQQLGLSETCFVIGHIARFDPMKDHKTFIKACNIAIKQEPKLNVVMIGRNINDKNLELANEITKTDCANNFYLLGEIPHLADYYPLFDVFCLSSAFGEGFPNVIGEAMSCGVICIATDVGDAQNIIDNTGFIVKPKDADELAKTIINTIKLNQKDKDNLSQKARVRIENEFSITTITKKYEAFYMQILGEKK